MKFMWKYLNKRRISKRTRMKLPSERLRSPVVMDWSNRNEVSRFRVIISISQLLTIYFRKLSFVSAIYFHKGAI